MSSPSSAQQSTVVVLKSDSQHEDEIILAKVPPAGTLRAAWESTVDRMRVPLADNVVPGLRAVDHLQIPIVSFGVVALLKELEGLKVPTSKKLLRFNAGAR